MKNHNQYNGGIPDVWYSGSKADLWVEYKFITLPKKDDTLIDLTALKNPILSPLQQQWLAERHKEGRNVVVVVGSKLGGVWLSNLDWSVTLSTYSFREHTISRNAIAETITSFVM